MNIQEYTLDEISYLRKEDCRIMEAVLRSWFRNPKTLNYVDPRISFPFNLKKWKSVSYKLDMDSTKTFVIKDADWIIGHISIRVKESTGHLFHLFIDPKYRQNGLAKKLVDATENHGKKNGCKTFILNVVKKNIEAINLYEKLGYVEVNEPEKKSLKMTKVI
ncbi:MAG: GNAT family N-acetyltransferase [Candidatus Marinimicrobia bacterium]|jgi:ribosomal protein S18 acetylase RimI-like enzyme|nr:GNAT family N-acetyltransferase [Candidatus Neomarinimicrobiota bacterium]MBT3501910.1 GNAT family N-acetyltransferase [Candidatus Neomarinimicrobiota bacterium]MBT3838564.1 GNAT family N-acetyltransferase [Candidatus Neomarinimicrobiota bacterium]MBT3999822.1 GNAT family N-acetyltransferase [Candidatus Neomarinimicrobiota bacterium]MBT4281877.1 GNAT family N-acetyltransferase [Candidatus Neomarinimicrobiota bacterium]